MANVPKFSRANIGERASSLDVFSDSMLLASNSGVVYRLKSKGDKVENGKQKSNVFNCPILPLYPVTFLVSLLFSLQGKDRFLNKSKVSKFRIPKFGRSNSFEIFSSALRIIKFCWSNLIR